MTLDMHMHTAWWRMSNEWATHHGHVKWATRELRLAAKDNLTIWLEQTSRIDHNTDKMWVAMWSLDSETLAPNEMTNRLYSPAS
mmetsp:Transcript_30387/g.59493  ORF Transcript_30387/g.59493 Transcript_30387/m.59493 type:complete len:84 (-) Transcript_30387:64-315(-)